MTDPTPTISGPTIDQWLHGVELVIVVVVLPTARTLINTVISLRDSVRDLTTATSRLTGDGQDHEKRIRDLERAVWGQPMGRRESDQLPLTPARREGQ